MCYPGDKGLHSHYIKIRFTRCPRGDYFNTIATLKSRGLETLYKAMFLGGSSLLLKNIRNNKSEKAIYFSNFREENLYFKNRVVEKV